MSGRAQLRSPAGRPSLLSSLGRCEGLGPQGRQSCPRGMCAQGTTVWRARPLDDDEQIQHRVPPPRGKEEPRVHLNFGSPAASGGPTAGT